MFGEFFEKSGKFLFQRVNPLLFLTILGVAPLISGFLLFNERQSVEILQSQFTTISKKTKTAFKKKARKERFLKNHNNSDPYFLDKEIESISFLENEKMRLKSWLSHPAISNKELLRDRLNFLESEDNCLIFIDDEILFSKNMKETLERQREPVEVDQDDLKHLLSMIEEIPLDSQPHPSNRPQLIICDFSLTKKLSPLQNEVFELKMDILKREFQKL
jgi:hypothetical protein